MGNVPLSHARPARLRAWLTRHPALSPDPRSSGRPKPVQILSIRFRNVPQRWRGQTSSDSLRQEDTLPWRTSCSAYVQLESAAAVARLVAQLGGRAYGGHHLFLDRATLRQRDRQRDRQRPGPGSRGAAPAPAPGRSGRSARPLLNHAQTVFLSNLPHRFNEEELWSAVAAQFCTSAPGEAQRPPGRAQPRPQPEPRSQPPTSPAAPVDLARAFAQALAPAPLRVPRRTRHHAPTPGPTAPAAPLDPAPARAGPPADFYGALASTGPGQDDPAATTGAKAAGELGHHGVEDPLAQVLPSDGSATAPLWTAAPILLIRIVRDSHTQEGTGVAFVTFRNPAHARAARESGYLQLDARRASLRPYQSASSVRQRATKYGREDRPPPRRVSSARRARNPGALATYRSQDHPQTGRAPQAKLGARPPRMKTRQ